MKSVSIIGSGNVATHLAKNLFSQGIAIDTIYSRSIEQASILALAVDAKPIQDLKQLNSSHSDFIIIAIKDDVIAEISDQLSANSIIAHTSGTVDISALKQHQHIGVFYPLQTFSKTKDLDFSQIPMCIEGNSDDTQNALVKLASSISNDVRLIDSETRKNIHIAAVFACNFTNHMFTAANSLLEKTDLDLSVLKPLIRETVDKAFLARPENVQTGPAIRKDFDIMGRHQSMLKQNPDLQNIYTHISNSIINWKNE